MTFAMSALLMLVVTDTIIKILGEDWTDSAIGTETWTDAVTGSEFGQYNHQIMSLVTAMITR